MVSDEKNKIYVNLFMVSMFFGLFFLFVDVTILFETPDEVSFDSKENSPHDEFSNVLLRLVLPLPFVVLATICYVKAKKSKKS